MRGGCLWLALQTPVLFFSFCGVVVPRCDGGVWRERSHGDRLLGGGHLGGGLFCGGGRLGLFPRAEHVHRAHGLGPVAELVGPGLNHLSRRSTSRPLRWPGWPRPGQPPHPATLSSQPLPTACFRAARSTGARHGAP